MLHLLFENFQIKSNRFGANSTTRQVFISHASLIQESYSILETSQFPSDPSQKVKELNFANLPQVGGKTSLVTAIKISAAPSIELREKPQFELRT